MSAPPSPARGPARATIKDVSRVAGVSIKTVSRVLNNEPYVRPETRERIERAMAELSFAPSAAARALGGGRSFQIALICDNPSPAYVYDMQKGLRQRCREDGVRMIAQPYDRDADDLLAEITSLVDELRPDGLVLTPPICDNPTILARLKERGVPFVRVSPSTTGDVSSSVMIDNEAAAHEVVAHLVALGHRRIGLIAGHPDYAASGQRMSGYLRALREANLPVDLTLIRQGLYDFISGESAAAALLDLPDPPTAIFASSDDMAAGALACAHDRGVKVPDALSIAGFDDRPLASVVWPPLTTMAQPTRDLAYVAADLLLAAGDRVDHRVLPHRLIVRASTGRPA